MAPTWSERAEKSRGLPNLGFGGTLVTAFVTSFFAAQIAGVVCVIIVFGPHAYFADGLRLTDWKHGILSDGQKLPWSSNTLLGISTLLLWASLIACAEFIAGVLAAVLKPFPSWVTGVFRCIGGAALLGFSTWWVYARGRFLMHPIPLSALIGGLVLIWKGVAGPLSSFIKAFFAPDG